MRKEVLNDLKNDHAAAFLIRQALLQALGRKRLTRKASNKDVHVIHISARSFVNVTVGSCTIALIDDVREVMPSKQVVVGEELDRRRLWVAGRAQYEGDGKCRLCMLFSIH